jgi:lipid-binding SYLF domain-containing protein
MFSLTKGAIALALVGAQFVAPRQAAAPSKDEHQDVLNTIAHFRKEDPEMGKFFDKSVGYVVLPTIGKGAVGIGGAYGTGELLVNGEAAGKVTMTQVTVGVALGGQTYSEIIFFESKAALDAFRKGETVFAAQMSAVALKSGAAKDAKYKEGIAVFSDPKEGLMGEASVGGQKFTFKPY